MNIGRIAIQTGVAAALLALLGVGIALFMPNAPLPIEAERVPPSTGALDAPGSGPMAEVDRGRQLATLGNCQHCHTPRGASPYSGGRAIPTPFGTVYSSNLTPSPQGLGSWTADDFWRALHHGQSRDGRWLYPAFPYTNTTHISRTDSDALWAFLKTLPPSDREPPPHALEWPYRTQAALKVWRALYFRPASEMGESAPDASVVQRSDAVLRGAYLARGLAHCSACHAPRDGWGGAREPLALTGGTLPGQGWYAPSLHDPQEGGVQSWPRAAVVALFQTGRTVQGSPHAQVTGPMAEVVQHSTQHWPEADLDALAAYLQQLPTAGAATPPAAIRATAESSALGERVYGRQCAECHGEHGEGRRAGPGPGSDWAYPPLAQNRAVTLASPANLIQMVMNGGFGPSTAGHPRPFGMPPFVLDLSDAELAAVLTHIRTQWGHQASAVSERQVQLLRGSPAH